MSPIERSAESGSALGVEGIARLDVVLRENELEWRHITDAIAVNVVVQSPTGTCLFANRTALEYWGLSLDDVMVANYCLVAVAVLVAAAFRSALQPAQAERRKGRDFLSFPQRWHQLAWT